MPVTEGNSRELDDKSASELPPRIIVELPDGEVVLGQDETCVPTEPGEPSPEASTSHHNVEDNNRRMLEINGLLSLMAHRRRALVVLIGVDIIYTVMTAASAIVSGDWDREEVIIAIQAGSGLVIDFITFAATLRVWTEVLAWSQLGQLAVFILTVVLSFHPILLIRVLILFILVRLVAAAKELKWITSDASPTPFWPSLHYTLVGRGLGYSGPYRPTRRASREPNASAARPESARVAGYGTDTEEAASADSSSQHYGTTTSGSVEDDQSGTGAPAREAMPRDAA